MTFYVYGQQLRMKYTVVASNTIDYLAARFVFQTEDWDGAAKTAVFEGTGKTYSVLLTNDAIRPEDHLNLAAGEWIVHVVGTKTVGETTQRITTTQVRFMVDESGAVSGEELPEVTASYGEQILAQAQEARNIAKSVRDDADAGKFKGDTGPAGPQGAKGETGTQGPKGDKGDGYIVSGLYETLAALETARPTGKVGEAWFVGTADSNTVYQWDVNKGKWVDVGALKGPQGEPGKDGEKGAQGDNATDEQVSSAVSTWLTDHPEATTTVQDGSVTSQKLNDDICSITEPLASEVLMENASFNRRYADTANNLYFNSYAIETAGENIYKVPVKAGVLYTIIPYSPQLAVYCQSAVINPPSETLLGVWTGDAACLGTPSYVGKVDLVNRYSFSLSDRTNKFRYTPQQDGYIVTSYPADTGPMIFKGASPNEGFEEFLNDPENDWALNTAPLYTITPAKSERMKVRYGAKLSPTFSRAIRRAEYYQNIVSSSFQMVCIGDSLTFGSSVGVGNRYTDFLQAKLNISVLNWGHNGVTATDGLGMDVTASAGKGASGIIAQHLQRSLDKFIKGQNINNNAFESTLRTHYIFTIFLGTNDWINNAPLGSYGDTSDASTFFNGYKKLVARIRELYPNSALIFITPLAQYYNNLHYYQANTAGYSVLDYNLAIHEIAMMTRNAWVIDMTESAYIKEKESSPSGVYVDTVHIGRKAHILLAHELEKAVMNITMMNGYDYVKLNTVAATDSFAGQK